MARRYRVKEPLSFASVGDEVLADAFPDIAFPALVEGGLVEAITPRVPCPSCEENPAVKAKDVPSFEKQETLSEHYAAEHPALVAPDFEEVV